MGIRRGALQHLDNLCFVPDYRQFLNNLNALERELSHWLEPSPFIANANDCHVLDQSSERRMTTTALQSVQDHGSSCLYDGEG